MSRALTCLCGLEVKPETAIYHKPFCPLDDRPQASRIAQAISDPGSVTKRQRVRGEGMERLVSWQTRAVMAVINAETTQERGLMFLDDAPGGDTVEHTGAGPVLRCQTRAANAEGHTFRCGEDAGHRGYGKQHNFVAEHASVVNAPQLSDGGS